MAFPYAKQFPQALLGCTLTLHGSVPGMWGKIQNRSSQLVILQRLGCVSLSGRFSAFLLLPPAQWCDAETRWLAKFLGYLQGKRAVGGSAKVQSTVLHMRGQIPAP